MTVTEANDKVLREAKERFRKCREWESSARVKFLEDVRFGNGDSKNLYQWSDQVAQSRLRAEKPILTINRVRQYCLQIVNDARQNKAQIEIRAVGDGASFKSAEIYEGIIRHIEYISNAQQAYDNACWSQVFGGIGWWRVTTEYVSDESFDQEIYIKRVPDALSVYLDPNIQEYDGSDARFGFVFRDMDLEQFKSDYPKYKDVLPTTPLGEYTGMDDSGWIGKDRIRIAEYYRKVDKDDRLHHMPDGTTVRESDVHPDALSVVRESSMQSREVSRQEIEWYLIAGNEVIEQREWLGKYIPLVRVVGEETVIDGIMDRRGHCRALIDAQRAYNYYTSAGIEYVALQSKTPWIAPVQAIEGYETDWAASNIQNLAVLPYNHINDAGQEIPRPEREQPPVFAPAYLEGMKVASNEMMMASGQFEAIMGMESNERSGKAITERQRAALNSTYHFVDHMASAIRFTGRLLVDLVPKIYDTARVLKIMAIDGTPQTVQLDPNAAQAHQPVPGLDPESLNPQQAAAIFNPNVGQYDVEADIGPAYATRRQEAFNALSDILAQNESLAPIVGDLMFRSADFPLADEIANRMKNMVPPQALGSAPDPQVQQLQQMLAQQHQVMQTMGQELLQAKSKAATSELQKEIDWYKAETERLKAVGAIDPAAMMPVVRQLVSEVLGVPVNQVIAHHALENSQLLSQLQVPPDATHPQTPQAQPAPPAQPG